MPTIPPIIDPAPPVPQRGVRATFGMLVDAFNTWKAASVAQFAAVASNVHDNAVEVFSNAQSANTAAGKAALSEANAAASAAAAAVTTGATLWVSGQVVAQDAVKISPLDRRTYRRKTAGGVSATDPAIDAANYVLLSADVSALMPLASYTVSAPVGSIEWLNLFSDVYSKYVIEIEGIAPNMRVAVGGVVAQGASDYQTLRTDGAAGTSASTFTLTSNGGVICSTVEIRGARTSSTKSVDVRGLSGTAITMRGGAIALSSPLSGFQLYPYSGGNFTSGTVRVYGVRANP